MMLDEPCASGEQNETNTASLVSTAITMDVETQTEEQSGTTRMDAETQTEEFDYLLNARPSGYHAPDKEFFDTDEMMDARLSPLVSWPDRERLWRTMPVSFQYAFGKQVTVIIDCFEVFIERPTNLLARAQTFSNYKHHNTIKILIGITPQGTICFVSEAWGGRTSDKYLTENCGFLENLLPGDMVMADRGFTICESVGLKQAKLVIPAFTKGKSQLHPVDVERTRGIASVRIHVERVIGLLRQKYTILEGPLPTDFLSSNRSGTSNAKTPMIDQIIRVCSALVNLCPPIIPFD